MAYDSNKVYRPDFLPPTQQGWTDFGPDDALIDAGPAVSAFKSRFMGGGPAPADAHAPMAHGGDMDGMAPMGHEEIMGGGLGPHDMGGASPLAKPKSL